MTDLILILTILLYVSLVILIPLQLYKRGVVSKYFVRKFVHTTAGLTILIIPFLSTPFISLIISSIVTTVLRFLNSKSKFKLVREIYEVLAEEEEIELGYLQGPFGYSLAITVMTLLAFLFPQYTDIIISSIFIMIFGDTLAGVIGRRYGKHKICIFKKKFKRSCEGSLSMFLISFLITYITLSVINYSRDFLLTSVIISILATVIEMFSPSKWDDLTVPIGTSLISILILTII